MKKSDILKLIKGSVSEILVEQSHDSADKMKDAIIAKVHANINNIAQWVLEGDSKSFEKFFESMQNRIRTKYIDYENPEKFTDKEEGVVKKVLNQKISIAPRRVSIRWAGENGIVYVLYKELYADGKNLRYLLEPMQGQNSSQKAIKTEKFVVGELNSPKTLKLLIRLLKESKKLSTGEL